MTQPDPETLEAAIFMAGIGRRGSDVSQPDRERRLAAREIISWGPTCDKQPSPYSTALCEKSKGHDDGWHAGRTQGGYWKVWDDRDPA